MTRRIFAILLAILLAVMLCEVHICCGEDCAFCAQTEPVRRISAAAAVCLWAVCILRLTRTEAAETPARRRVFGETLVDMKVELTD